MVSKIGEGSLFYYFCNFAVACLILFIHPPVAHSIELFTDYPQLRTELGMHASQIDSIGVNKDCSLMVTGSSDKAARLWNLPPAKDKGIAAPRLLRTFRPPSNSDSFNGRIYAVAIDPAGKFVVASGYTPSPIKGRWAIYIFDAVSAQVVATINDNPYRVMSLAFSRDGAYLVATMKSGYGIRVWKTGNWKQPIAEDRKDYSDSYGATFDSKGRLYTTTYDRGSKCGYIRAYAAQTFRLENEVKVCEDLQPIQVAAQSRGSLIAVGFAGRAEVFLYDTLEGGLKFVGRADTTGLREHVGQITWSSDDKYLFAGGSYQKGKKFQIRVWGGEGKGTPIDFDGPTWYISQLLTCGEDIAIGSREPAFGVIDTRGNRKIWQSRVGLNMVEKQFGRLKVSADGLRISFDMGTGGDNYVLFDASNLSLRDASEQGVGMFPTDFTSLPITKWNERETIPEGTRPVDPLFNGQSISPKLTALPGGEVKEQDYRYSNDEEWTALAVSNDKKNFVLATEWRIRGYDAENFGRPLWVNRSVPGKVWAVNLARNGKVFVAAYDDGTFRWHRMSDGKELLALLVHPEEYRRWIAWTPQGYFYASIGGEDLIGWHINDGPDKSAHFYPVHHFRERFNRPNIVRRVLITLDEDAAIKEEQDRMGKAEEQLRRIRASDDLPPVLEIVAPQHNVRFDSTEQIISVVVSARSNLRPTRIDVLVDGMYREQTRAIEPREIDKTIRLQVHLPQKDSRVTLQVYSSEILGVGQSIDFKWAGPPSTVSAKPRLYGLAIGITDYKKNILQYANKDAEDFAAALKTQEGKLYSRVEIDILNKNVSKDAIISALKRLATKLRTEPPDTVTALFYSGHGFSNQRRFYFLPSDSDKPEKDGLSEADFYYYLNDIRGRKIVFVDACWSNALLSGVQPGLAGLSNFIRSKGGIGTFLYAATDSGEASTAQECKDLKNGCFTKALVEAIGEGLADQYEPLGLTDTYELHTYLSRRVSDLTDKAQRPNMVMTDEGLMHFNVAMHSTSHP